MFQSENDLQGLDIVRKVLSYIIIVKLFYYNYQVEYEVLFVDLVTNIVF